MSLSKSKQEMVSEFRTVEILDAARNVFTDKGFRDATVDDIAEAAGISKGTVYLYFPSKQEIYLATLARESARHIHRFQESLRPGMSTRDVIFCLAVSFMQHLDENREFVLICIAEFGRIPSEKALPEPVRLANRKLTDILRKSLEQGMRAHRIRPVPAARMASAILLFVKNWAIRRTTEDAPVPALDDANMLADLVWKGVIQ